MAPDPDLQYPNDWRQDRLHRLAAVTAGGSAPQGEHYFNGPHPFVRVQHLDESDFFVRRWDSITDEAVEDQKLKRFPAGTIVLPKSGASIRLEKRAILPVDAYVVSHLATVNSLEGEIDRDFLFFSLKSKQLAKEKAGGYPTLTLGDLKETPIQYPSLAEQRSIAHVLRTVQRAKEVTEKVIAAARQLKQSFMRHLFTYGPVPFGQADQVELKETEIGEIPTHWDVRPIEDFGLVVTGSTPSTKKPEYYGGPFMFITPGDIGDGPFVTVTAKYLSEEGLGVSRVLPAKTILTVCIGATIGKTAITTQENCATNQQINSVLPCDGGVPEYLYYAITHRASKFPELAGRAAVPIVNKSNFSKFLIARCPDDEQDILAHQLISIDQKLESEQKRAQALDALFRTLLHHLMTGKVRVGEEAGESVAEVV